MKIVVQRVKQAKVEVGERVIGEIGKGLVVLLGVSVDDEGGEVEWLVEKLVGLRIFEDGEQKMNRSVVDVGGEALVVSQFTLYGDCQKGKRPSFIKAARPEKARELYDAFVEGVKKHPISVETGEFGAEMAVSLVNDGPVTLILERESLQV